MISTNAESSVGKTRLSRVKDLLSELEKSSLPVYFVCGRDFPLLFQPYREVLELHYVQDGMPLVTRGIYAGSVDENKNGICVELVDECRDGRRVSYRRAEGSVVLPDELYFIVKMLANVNKRPQEEEEILPREPEFFTLEERLRRAPSVSGC